MVVATVTFGDMLISKTMTVMTSDHTKTKIGVFHKTNGQANCGMEWGVSTWSSGARICTISHLRLYRRQDSRYRWFLFCNERDPH